jgi:16S rRNA (cytidine1402-2'-O)-methyltransferase
MKKTDDILLYPRNISAQSHFFLELEIISMRQERSQGKCAHTPPPSGRLFIVGVPIGHPDDLTIRGLATLKQVDLIAAKNPRATQALLTHHGIHVTLTLYDRHNAAEKVPVLLERLSLGCQIALVSECGMPVVYDPGRLLIAAASQRNIPVEVIPGTSAVVAAAALAGLDGDAFLFEGRWTGDQRALKRRLQSLRSEHRTMIFFPPAQALKQILTLLVSILGNRQVVVAIDVTQKTQRIVRGRAQTVLASHFPYDASSQVTLVVKGLRKTGGGAEGKR